MSESAKWYVVHTYSGYENKVKDNLEKSVENNGMQNLIPDGTGIFLFSGQQIRCQSFNGICGIFRREIHG